MDFSGSQTLTVPIETVWAYLLDVRKVAACAPGFQSLEALGDEHWKMLVTVGIGPVRAKFTLDVTRPEMREPELMVVKARGKAPGNTVELSGRMQLVSLAEAQTRMDWQAHVLVNGTLASVGARLMGSTSEKLTTRFFDCLQAHLQTV
ncbi:CoxG family protein [Dictyobacter arantiisoli]|uniref:Carbon monoxide dehydrogenase n=1 Tax=Dictyobacter arantiisoli TaxID=2014874 RepID=A0A5A5TIE8_9CHLR|nr:carbon monoxide dehydrogenase subunit G [Dictyobacter arantiisoli]GCF10995.1 carbon monoxide dehydrogenase [Dictyobacter arantiisoli]